MELWYPGKRDPVTTICHTIGKLIVVQCLTLGATLLLVIVLLLR